MRRVIHAGNARMRQRPTMVRAGILMAAVLLVAGHGALLYYMRAHIGLSAGTLAGVILFLLVKHLGLLAPPVARFRRRSGVKAASTTDAKEGNL